MMGSTRRGFLGALAAVPGLIGLGKRAVPAEPKLQEMTTVILEWKDGTRENLSVARPPGDVVYAPRYLESPWRVGPSSDSEAFPMPRGPTIERVEFRRTGRSTLTPPPGSTDASRTIYDTIPIYEEI